MGVGKPDKLSGSPEVGEAWLSNSTDMLSGSPEVDKPDKLSASPEGGEAGLGNSSDKLSGSPEMGEAGLRNSPEVGEAGLSNSSDKLSGSPEVGEANPSSSPEVGEAGLSSSPEVGDATSILISALISISEIDGVAEAAGLSSEVGDVGLSSSPVFIGDGHGRIGIGEVIVHGLLVLGFLITGCPRKFLLTIGIFRIGAGAKLCNDVDDKGA